MFIFCNLLADEETAGYFTLIVFLLYCDCKSSVALHMVPCVGPQCIIVVFSGHTQFLFLFFLFYVDNHHAKEERESWLLYV